MHKSITTSTTATATTATATTVAATTGAATADQASTPLPHNPLGSKLVRPLSEPYDVPQHQQHHPVPPSATTLPITAPASEISNGATEDGEQRGYERLEWQTLLTSVVRGDLLRGEKSRYTDSTRPSSTSEDRQAMMGDLWYYIRALMRGWSVDRETAELELERNQAAELVIERVMSFTVDTSPAALADPARTPYAQVRNLLDQVDRLMLLYPSDRQAMLAKPWLASPEFMERLEIIQTWATVIWQLQVCIHTAMVWLGADAGLGIIGGGSGGSTTTATAASSSSLEYRLSHCRFIEFLLRERKHLEGFFGSVLAELFGALWRVRAAQITYSAEYAHMGLPTSIPRIDAWIRFTELLFRECVARRVEFVCEMRDTPVALVDETLADLKEVIRSALRCREEVVGLTVHDIGWAPAQRNSQELDRYILKAIDVYFDMLFKRLRNVPRQQVHERDAEIVNVELGSWLSLVGDLPIGTETVIARLMMQTQRLMIRFTAHLEAQIKIVPAPSTQPSSAEISPSLPASLVEDCRNRSRQMLRLGKQMANRAITSSEYECHNSAELIFALHTAGYVLVYTFGAFEDHGEYVFARLADEYVRGKPIRAMMTLRGVADDASAAIGSNAFKAGSTASMARTADMRLCDHMLVLATQDDVDWSGDVLDMPDLARPDMGIEPGRVRLITASQAELKRCRPFFENSVQHCSLSLAEFQMSPLALVQREVIKLRRATFRLTEGILSLPHAVIEVHNRHSPCPELLHEAVNLISECASLAGVVFDPAHSFQLRIHMVKLCSTWCTFLVDNCEALAEDRRTFKWLVEALEMTAALANEQVITRLSEVEFRTLRSNVGRALTLLTSHFDAFERRPLIPLSAAVAATAVTSTGPSPVSSMATDPTRTISLPQRRTLHDLHRAWVAGIRRLDDSHDSKRRSKERIGQVLEPSGNPEVEHLAVLASNPAAYPCRWQQGRYIGGGAYGSVYLAINLDLREYMAVKEIRFPDTTTLAATLNKIHDEMHIMSKLLHPNIVQYYGIEVHRDKVCLFMEYCAGGALSQQIDQGRIEDEYLVKLFTVQILSGLEYLHHHSIVHRDIKPDNILLSETGIVKFIDFGAAKSLTQNQQQSQQSQHHPIMQRTLVGTPNYLAPEVITNSHSENSSAQDIWSLGCVVLELVTGHRPWSHLDNEYAVMFRVVNESPALPPPSQMSEEGLDFLSTCFTRNPAKRPTASQLLEHPWMADMQAFRNPVELSKSVEELESEQPH
ncbi:hypothetical protein GQ42DRAFT_118042 [Ramicandelaber brevisporus]|nr:hypothetical protein GQ42DRAFT_118042 [Ramicandelaber brevisporus]